MLYLSFIGNHDQVVPGQPFGATLTIFIQYKEQLNHVFLFVTPSKTGSEVNYRQIAEQIRAIMLQEKPDVNVEVIDLLLDNPVYFDLVYPVMLDATQKILENEGFQKAKKIINITSGTPTMTACWVLLHKSGLIPNSIIVQAFETKYAQQRGASTQEVNLEIDDFPKIIAPSALKRQLTIVHREKEQLTKKVQLVALDEKIPELIGHSQAIRQIKEQILYDIDEHTHVLITGDRGTGKEVVAHAIWRLYHRENDEKLTVFDCGAFPKELIISELFGHKRGAFTGATEDNPGI
jgi:sigma54-dependent transcription regulator